MGMPVVVHGLSVSTFPLWDANPRDTGIKGCPVPVRCCRYPRPVPVPVPGGTVHGFGKFQIPFLALFIGTPFGSLTAAFLSLAVAAGAPAW